MASNFVNNAMAGTNAQLSENVKNDFTDIQLSADEVAQQSVQSVKNSATTAANAAVSAAKDKANEIKGIIPGTTNGYVAKVQPERAKSYNAAEGTFSNINLNNLVLPYDNVLQKYDNHTWNFSLYTMDRSEYKLFWDNPSAEISKYVIAQSGVTGRYSINSVKMTSAGPATPGMTSNYSLNVCTMEIQENGGMSLFDDIVVLSNELGYKKFLDVPIVMELNFVGYDSSGEPMIIPGLKRTWGMRINTISGSASNNGGTMTYTLTMTSTRGGIMENKDWTMLEPYSCSTATFGEFVKQLETQLNNMAKKQYGYLSSVYPDFANDKYFEIYLPNELANMTINYDSKQSPEVGTTPSGQNSSKQFSWAANVPISKAIDDVLDCCMPLHESTDKRRQFVNIIPVSKYIGFDFVRNTSAFKNFFYIIKYKIGDLTSAEDIQPEKFNVEYFIQNADKINDPDDAANPLKLNIKRYDYQFSGLNNEVLNLDLKFDQGFNLAVVRNPQSQIDPGNSAGTHQAELLELGDVQYGTSTAIDRQKLWAKTVDLQDKQDQGGTLTDEEKQFIRDSQNAIAEKQMTLDGQDDQEQNNLSLSPSLPKYIEDFRENYDLTEAGTAGIGSGTPRVDTIPIEPQNIKTQASGAKMDNSSDDEMQRRLARDNYYNRSFLAKLNMQVTGDPYWLGWGDYTYLDCIKKAVAGEDLDVGPADRHFANYLTSEAYLLLNLKPIVAISDETGILEINQSSVFSQTLYRVNTVTSEFNSNGTFTQTLTGGIVMRSLRKKEQYTDNTEGNASGG